MNPRKYREDEDASKVWASIYTPLVLHRSCPTWMSVIPNVVVVESLRYKIFELVIRNVAKKHYCFC